MRDIDQLKIFVCFKFCKKIFFSVKIKIYFKLYPHLVKIKIAFLNFSRKSISKMLNMFETDDLFSDNTRSNYSSWIY